MENTEAENPIEETEETEKRRTIEEVQEDFANVLGFNTQIVNEQHTEHQSEEFKIKIKALFSDTENSKNEETFQKIREKIFESVWAQRKYTNKQLLYGIIFVLVTNEKEHYKAKKSTIFSCHPVFVIRRCQRKNDANTSDCCKIFVDETGRVYQNFQFYIKENVLPIGLMVLPKNGIYTFDENGHVELDVYATPQSTKSKKVISVVDKSVNVVGLAAAVGAITASVLPFVAIPAIVGYTAVGAGGYLSARSASQLYDRHKHEKSINIKDEEARGSWFNLATGTVSLGSAAVACRLARGVAAARNMNHTAAILNGINATSMLLSGIGVGNEGLNLFLKLKNDAKVRIKDILLFAANLIIFTHSVRNFKLASKMIDESQNMTIKDFRETLSKRNRKQFDKFSRQSMAMHGESAGKTDIIRIIENNPTTSELKEILQAKKFKIPINNQNATAIKNFNSITKKFNEICTTDIKSNTQNVIVSSYNPDISLDSKITIKNLSKNLNDSITVTYSSNQNEADKEMEIDDNVYKNIGIMEKFIKIVNLIRSNFNQNTCDIIMQILKKFIIKFLENILQKVRIPINSESILFKILIIIEPKLSIIVNTKELLKYLIEHADEILLRLKDYYLSFKATNENVPIKCKYCTGSYSVITL